VFGGQPASRRDEQGLPKATAAPSGRLARPNPIRKDVVGAGPIMGPPLGSGELYRTDI